MFSLESLKSSFKFLKDSFIFNLEKGYMVCVNDCDVQDQWNFIAKYQFLLLTTELFTKTN